MRTQAISGSQLIFFKSAVANSLLSQHRFHQEERLEEDVGHLVYQL
jgi:hypothetical protein